MKLFKIYIVVLFLLLENRKEAYRTPLRDVKATGASKSTQQKTNRGSVWIEYNKSLQFCFPMKYSFCKFPY